MKNWSVWIFRAILFVMIFGMSALPYDGNANSPMFDKVINGTALLGIVSLVVFYFRFPPLYKLAAWLIGLGVIALLLESKYEYGQYVYSYFVIKRFAYCAMAMMAFVVAKEAAPFKLEYIIYLIFIYFFINQILLGQIFSYALTSETRSVNSNETMFLVLPCLYYLVKYMENRKIGNLLGLLFTFAFIVFLLHRSVISASIVGIGTIAGLSILGKVPTGGFPMGRTVATFVVIVVLLSPVMGMLSGNKVDAFLENIGGIVNPQEDNTGSWRLEQSQHYVALIPERPLLGWRYEGYDRGEIMVNEDFPDKGTIIHSQYIDQLYNYGAAGLCLNLLIILGTLLSIYLRNPRFTIGQTVLFGFVTSGLIYAVSYQLPFYFWAVVGLSMYFGMYRPDDDVVDTFDDAPNERHDTTSERIVLSNNIVKL